MQSLIAKLYKELTAQQKYLKREDTRNAKKSNQLLLQVVTLLDQEIQKKEKIEVKINIEKKSK